MAHSFGERPETANPYQAPTEPSSTESPNPLFIPGIILLLDALFWLLYILMSLAVMLSPNSPMQGDELAFVRTTSTVGYGLMFVLSLIAAAGAVAMMSLRWKWLAWTGCIVGLLPIFGPCFGLTIPIAVWALVLLRRPGINVRFT